MRKYLFPFLTILLNLAIFNSTFAQEALEPKASPLDLAKATLKDTYIKVTYSRPHKKGRVIFGELVPYGKVWRMGANEATEITLTGAIKMDNNTIPAGTYALFCIPETDKWTIIVNKEVGQWGSYRYNDKADLLRFTVPVSKSDKTYEPFTIKIEAKGSNGTLNIIWEETLVSIPLSAE